MLKKLGVFFILSGVWIFISHCAMPKKCNEGGKTKVYLTDGKRFKALLKERDALCNENNSLKADTTQKGKKIRVLQNELKNAQQENQQLNQKNKECETQLAQQKQNYQKLNQEYQSEKQNLQSIIDAQKNELQRKGRSILDKDTEIAYLKNINQEKDSIIKALEKKLKAEKEKNEMLSKSAQQSIAERDKKLQEKDKELAERERLLKQKEQRVAELEAIMSRQDSALKALNTVVKNALLGFNKDELSVEMKNGRIYVLMNDKLLFKSGSATVEEKGKEALKKLSTVLLKNPDIDILVEGHTDNLPIKNALYKDNWDLSTARANSIVRILSQEYKVPEKRLTAAGRAEFVPRADNSTAEGRAKNRRTEIILTPKLDELFKIIEK
ncbi:MAG: OmpA family protein [Bacteroidia bacterium]|nr:OmpA family protein [Bacteroidia bacterium]MDW8301836.1 OmpA family protein [Bacteroidia bacterium]